VEQFLGDKGMRGDEELKKAVTDRFYGITTEVCDAGIQKLVTQYDKCLNLHEDYAEK
jgi:hypothetical protein